MLQPQEIHTLKKCPRKRLSSTRKGKKKGKCLGCSHIYPRDKTGQPWVRLMRMARRLVVMVVRCHRCGVNYHSTILRCNRGNISVDPIDNVSGAAHYTSSYVGKFEKTQEAEMQRLVAAMDPDTPMPTAWQKVFMGALKCEVVSAQQACHVLDNLPLVDCSRPFVTMFIPKMAKADLKS